MLECRSAGNGDKEVAVAKRYGRKEERRMRRVGSCLLVLLVLLIQPEKKNAPPKGEAVAERKSVVTLVWAQ